MNNMKIVLIGFGSIGRRHAGNILKLGHSVVVVEPYYENRKKAIEMGLKGFKTLKEALKEKPEVAFVCTPTKYHVQPAIEALKANCHLFIEKPISDNLKGVKQLLTLAKKKKKKICVGCNMRYEEGLTKVKEFIESNKFGKPLSAKVEFGYYLPYWHPKLDYRKEYSANKKLGGGIILDAIHEIDYIRWMLGEIKTIYCEAGKISSLQIDTEDNAEIIMKTTKGIVINAHLDYINKKYTRNCKIVFEKGEIHWDFNKKTVQTYNINGKENIFKEKKDFSECYIDELKDFFKQIQGKKTKILDGNNAYQVLDIALKAKESSRKRKVISV